ncbi:hypothetical protein GGI43DRAFT_395592 [Trichoderma evansii]
MIQFIRFLLIVLPTLSSIAQGAFCTLDDIRDKNVAQTHCDCRPHVDQCTPVQGCFTCGLEIKKKCTHGGLSEKCYVGCTDKDWNTKGCGIWYHTLCNELQLCLKGNPSCQTSTQIKKGGGMSWIVLPEGNDPLVTTTDLLPGILEMAHNSGRYGGAFDFAQEKYDPTKQALALNSVRSRTMEQFHIHMCPKPQKGTKILKRLEKATPTSYMKYIPTLNPGDPNLWCLGVKGKGPIKNFVETIGKELAQLAKIDPKTQKPFICEGLASAAIIQDGHLNTWGCISENKDGPIGDFCDLP